MVSPKNYKNTKEKVCPPDSDTRIFDIVACVLQRDTLASYLFIICLDYVLQVWIDLMKQNGFTLKKGQEADDTLQKLFWMQTTQMT